MRAVRGGWLVLAVLAAWSSAGWAQQPPGAGQLQKDVAPPVRPSAPPPAIQLPAPAPVPSTAPVKPGATFELRDVVFTGNTVFGAALLKGLAEDLIGKQVSLTDLEEIARRVTERYQSAGYLLAQAVVPAQEIKDGVVEISVLEGRLAKVRVNRAPDAPVHEALLDGIAGQLRIGEPIAQRDLERTMLLLSDIPGIKLESALEPGDEPGTTDLVIDVTAAPRVLFSVDADNYGSIYTGENRLGLFTRLNSPLGVGDNLDVRLFTSSNADQLFGRLGYEVPVGYHGTRLGAAVSRVNYQLGREFQSLDAKGLAQTWEVSLTHPLIRSRAQNLYGRLNYLNTRLDDRIEAVSAEVIKNVDTIGLGLAYENRDGLFGGAYNSAGGTLSFGDLAIKSPVAREVDQSPFGRHTDGGFTVFAYQASRLQYLLDRTNLYLGLAGQWANKNLDSSQQIPIGGPRAVRAYPSSEALSDEGVVGTAEVRYSVTPTVTMSGFYDLGWGRFNKDPPPGVADNERTLRGFGIGVYWAAPWGTTLQASVAWRDSSPAESAPDRNPRIYLQISQSILPWRAP
jgi:hemolysin activation/secretion protein